MKKQYKDGMLLFWFFFKIGWFTFGGGWSILAQMEQEFPEAYAEFIKVCETLENHYSNSTNKYQN